jgi:L-lactate dehydrogenase
MKIGIVGAGMVGATAAYALVLRGIGSEIVLVDLNQKRALAEADDLLHAVPFAHPLQVRAGEYQDLAGSEVVIISAGVSQRPGETRLELLGRNSQVFAQIIPQIASFAPEAVLVVASNPVDIMTHLTAGYARQFGIPSSRVIGSGTTLDTARFRALLGKCLDVDPQHVHAYVLGEHGDSEVLAWSQISIGGIPLDEFTRSTRKSLCDVDHAEIEQQVRQAAYHIIEGKGATYYGVGSALARIVDAIWRNQRAILTVCTPLENIEGIANVTVSMPHLVGGQGILATLEPGLDPDEKAALHRSASLIRELIDELEGAAHRG